MKRTGGQTLEYGRVTRVSVRHIGRRLLTATLVAVASLWALYTACNRIYWYDYTAVRETLQDIPDVRVDSINGFDDGIHFTVIDAEVSLLSAPTKFDFRTYAACFTTWSRVLTTFLLPVP